MCRLTTPSAFLDTLNRLLALPTPVLLPSWRRRDVVGGLLLSYSGREAVRVRREERNWAFFVSGFDVVDNSRCCWYPIKFPCRWQAHGVFLHSACRRKKRGKNGLDVFRGRAPTSENPFFFHAFSKWNGTKHIYLLHTPPPVLPS